MADHARSAARKQRARMRRRLLGCLLVGLTVAAERGTAAVPATGSVAELAGLWKAQRWFGPEARGPLVIRKNGANYAATMAGQDVPVRVTKDEVLFELPKGLGSFRGSFQPGGELDGHWYPPRGLFTPVRLRPQGTNRWSGEVVSPDNLFTFYLLLQPRPDGTLGVILRNQERDWASLLGPDRLVRAGDSLKLMGRPVWRKQEEVIAKGSYDAEHQTLTLGFPDRGGSYDFQREYDQSDFYPRGNHPAKYVYRPPTPGDEGWPTGTLDEVDIDRPAMERLVQKLLEAPMDSANTPKVHALLVARHGKLVFEEYFHGENRDKLQDTRSAAKSVNSGIMDEAVTRGGQS